MSDYTYDPDAAGKADASRIDTSAAYVGQFKLVHAIKSERTGTEGLHFEFDSPSVGGTSFDVYTKKADGTPVFGYNQVNAMMAILGLRGLKGVPGKYEAYDSELGKRVETDGEVFPELTGKDIGLLLQKELYTKQDGKDGWRMSLFGIFHPQLRLTASELKEKKVVPEKFDKMVRALKDKDSRKAVTPEPDQPQVGAVATGNF